MLNSIKIQVYIAAYSTKVYFCFSTNDTNIQRFWGILNSETLERKTSLKTLLELKDLSKIYPSGEDKVYALNRISLTIGQGEFVAIVGQSGSGKSTLMNILGCLDIPTSGSYFLDGQNVASLNENQLALIRNEEIGFIFQGFNLIPGLTAFENVELPLIYRRIEKGKRRKLALNALKKVGLEHRVRHLPSQMSGGQQQRVAIARAIAASPPLILADEPTGNLDSASGAQILAILKQLNQEGKTVILITHDDSIARSAQHIIRIQDGKITKNHTMAFIDNFADYAIINAGFEKAKTVP